MQEKVTRRPFGKRIFSYMVARVSPYFLSIKPRIVKLEHNYMEATMKKRRAVHNHIKTVHAIAVCNLCEFTGGVLMEASIPKHRRWIPMGMEVQYLKKAKTDLRAACDLRDVDWENCDHVICKVPVFDANGEKVVYAEIKMKVSDKPKK